MLGTLGLGIDLMRDFEAHRQLQFAAQSAALFGLSQATQTDGTYSIKNAQANISAAVVSASQGNWNIAQFGPVNNTWSKPVIIDSSNVQFVANPIDANEFFTQVTAGWNGNNALQQFFIPLFFTSLSGKSVPNSVRFISTHSTVEVLGQPASRIGPGAPTTSVNQAITNFSGFASFPLAISNQQFVNIANPNQATTTYTVDLVSSTSVEFAGPAPPGHIKGCLVNLSSTGIGNNFYGNGQGDTAIDQLEGLLNYFGARAFVPTIAPAVVERGSQLNAFDPANPAFTNRANEISQTLLQLGQRYYIFPVLASDPSFTKTNTVVGFARLALGQITFTAGMPVAITITIGESVPLRNASSATGFASIPTNTTNLMPAPVFPFGPRQFDTSSGGVSIRPRGIVLAPALSPRTLNGT
jgi:hypothetical protein